MKKAQIILWAVAIVAIIGFIVLNLPQKEGDTPSLLPIAGFNKGAPFILTTHEGRSFNSMTDIPDGHYALIFFGFTHCPSICPTELQKFATVMDGLPKDVADKTIPLFITIDPERDNVDALASYVPQFHERIIGLTGDTETVHKVLNDWKIYYSKVEDPEYSEYTMDHSTYSYLVDDQMNIVALYRLQTTPSQIIENIKKTEH